MQLLNDFRGAQIRFLIYFKSCMQNYHKKNQNHYWPESHSSKNKIPFLSKSKLSKSSLVGRGSKLINGPQVSCNQKHILKKIKSFLDNNEILMISKILPRKLQLLPSLNRHPRQCHKDRKLSVQEIQPLKQVNIYFLFLQIYFYKYIFRNLKANL